MKNGLKTAWNQGKHWSESHQEFSILTATFHPIFSQNTNISAHEISQMWCILSRVLVQAPPESTWSFCIHSIFDKTLPQASFFLLVPKTALESSVVPHCSKRYPQYLTHPSSPWLWFSALNLDNYFANWLRWLSSHVGSPSCFFEMKEPQTLLKLRWWGISWLEETLHHFSY